MDPMDAIKQTFFQECDELLVAMEEGFITIENGSADDEVVNAVFRAVHSIKGGGGAFGFEDLVGFAHVFETALDDLRSGKISASPVVIKVLLRAGDILADHVKAARTGQPLASGVDTESRNELAALSANHGAQSADEDHGLEEISFAKVSIDFDDAGPADTLCGWHIVFAPYPALYAKANEPYLLLRELASLGDTTVKADLSKLPALDAFETDQSYLSWTITLVGDIPRDKVEEVFEFVTGDCDLTIAPLAAEIPAVEIGIVEEARPIAEGVAGKKDAGPAAAEVAARQTIRVDLDKVDRLVNLVGELVITQAMLSQRIHELNMPRSSTVGTGLAELEHLLRELQEGVMAIRTQPVKSVFQRMPRLVRELAAQTNKQVRLVVEGEATEVDKTVIERLGEPLTHMIRNAIDHGLETPGERRESGKAGEGTVTLSAAHRGGRIIIEVSDDGRGINRQKVREKAVERGLVPAGTVLSDEEVDNLIFLPGFSTASQVSNISGRGVGMDVVRRNIVDLGGRIVISSRPGRGSRFSLTLPLTLAVLDGMVVAVGDQTYVVPLAHIVESLKPRQIDVKPFGNNRTLLNVRGTYLPLVRTGEILGARGAVSPADGVVIVVESQGTGRLALAVDSIIGQKQVVIKSFEANYHHIEGIAAATILGDGRVALILDIDGLVSRCRAEIGGTTGNQLLPTGT
jgi:two-component system chemotaxis sensor kinase CheA